MARCIAIFDLAPHAPRDQAARRPMRTVPTAYAGSHLRPCLGEAAASPLRAGERLVVEIGDLDRQPKALSVSLGPSGLDEHPRVGAQPSAAFAAAVDDGRQFKRKCRPAYFRLAAGGKNNESSTGLASSPSWATTPFASSFTRRPTLSWPLTCV